MTTLFVALWAFTILPATVLGTEAPSASDLEIQREILLDKQGGRVDQVALLGGGGFAIRDYSWEPPDHQRIELFDAEGRASSSIAAFGFGPGKYVRLRDMAVDEDDMIWVADYGATRIGRYRPDGSPASSFLLQNPSYRPHALALDQERGRIFVAGCLPLETYLDQGCSLVHEYRSENGAYTRSYGETAPEAIARGWAGRIDLDLDVDRAGRVFLIQESVHKLFRIDPLGQAYDGYPIRSEIARAPTALSRNDISSTDRKEAVKAASYLLDRVIVSQQEVAVSMRRPEAAGHLLFVFDLEGRPLAADLEPPGRLVGPAPEGGWIFTREEGGRHRLLFASLPSLAGSE